MSGGMWIRVRAGSDPQALASELAGLGLWTRLPERVGPPGAAPRLAGAALAVLPHSAAVSPEEVARLSGVEEVLTPVSPHPRVDAQAGRTLDVAGVPVGGAAEPVLAAGPCAVESAAQVEEVAASVAAAGARILRGGAYKPRTSPYGFDGHGRPALEWLRRAADRHGLAVVTELTAVDDLPAVAEVADLVQIGSRNMQNFALLRAAGAAGRPVLLKRGLAATVEEWLLAGEHLLAAGAPGVVFCERGVRGFCPTTRNLLDLGAAALLRWSLQQPVWVDPSHAAGRRELVVPLARAALAAGVHGLLIEAHLAPETARCDGPQAVRPEALRGLVSAPDPCEVNA